jgi:hypothetical protein
MLEEKHIKQISEKKIISFVEDVYAEVLEKIRIQNNYLNDLEQCACMVLITEKFTRVCEESLGEDLQMFKNLFTQEKEQL